MYHFIVNRVSRSGRGRNVWTQIVQVLKQKKITYKVYFTEYQSHAVKIAEEICALDVPCTIIAVGGDGTVNEVLNGIKCNSNITFGYIPTGSSNDFARGLPTSNAPLTALDYILSPRYIRNMNVGCISYKNKKRAFGTSMGIGFDAAICLEALNTPLKNILNKIKLGKLTYIGIALKQLFLYRPIPITITIDEHKNIEYKKCYFITVMNQKYEGGGFKFCPDAENDDGYLNVCVVDSMIKAKIFLVFPTAFSGNHVKLKGITTFSCKKIQIHASSQLPVHTDGESCGYQTDITVDLKPEALRVISLR